MTMPAMSRSSTGSLELVVRTWSEKEEEKEEEEEEELCAPGRRL